ncbi:hypothetical protein N6H14_13605 [Paenibacillus sp. CC-CFT747]|nr:hypothetical protein N6H14_13605 [Paenibacillus sp. CC-CFT747]
MFEQLVAETAAKRIVLDSISLYRYGNLSVREQRETFYRLRSVLKRHGLTALLIREESLSEEDKPAFENYVFDGVIRLRLKVYMEKYRMRTLEVTKMRGGRFSRESMYTASQGREFMWCRRVPWWRTWPC